MAGFDAIAANWFGNDFMNVGIGGQTAPVIALTYPSCAELRHLLCSGSGLGQQLLLDEDSLLPQRKGGPQVLHSGRNSC